MKKHLLRFVSVALTIGSVGSVCAQNVPFEFDWKKNGDNTTQELVAINKTQLGTFTLYIELKNIINVRLQRKHTVLVRNSGDRILTMKPIDEERPMDVDVARVGIARGYRSKNLDSSFVYRLPYSTSKSAVRALSLYNLDERHFDGNPARGWKAFEFALERGDTVFAVRKGQVILVIDQYDLLPKGMEASYNSQSNDVVVEHPDGTLGSYQVFERGSICVREGDVVYPGTPLGRAGTFSENGNYMIRFFVSYPDTNPNYNEDDPNNSSVFEQVYYNPHFLTPEGVRQLTHRESYRSASSAELVQREMTKRELKAVNLNP